MLSSVHHRHVAHIVHLCPGVDTFQGTYHLLFVIPRRMLHHILRSQIPFINYSCLDQPVVKPSLKTSRGRPMAEREGLRSYFQQIAFESNAAFCWFGTLRSEIDAAKKILDCQSGQSMKQLLRNSLKSELPGLVPLYGANIFGQLLTNATFSFSDFCRPQYQLATQDLESLIPERDCLTLKTLGNRSTVITHAVETDFASILESSRHPFEK